MWGYTIDILDNIGNLITMNFEKNIISADETQVVVPTSPHSHTALNEAIASTKIEEMAPNVPERIVSAEELKGNIEVLQRNLMQLDNIPELVLQSKEGQEATQSLGEKVDERLNNFRQGVIDKFASLDSWKGRDRVFKLLTGIAGAAILLPLALQLSRSKWPEVGMALDAAPDALQQFIHMDIWVKATELFGGNDIVKNGSIWENGGIEVNNLLADISSGKEALSLLSPEQLDILKNGMNSGDFEVLTSPYLKDPVGYAESGGISTTMTRIVYGNMPLTAAAGFGIATVINKIGGIANKYKHKTANK